MKNILRKSILFKDIDIATIDSMLSCLEPIKKDYVKDQTILAFGAKTAHVGIVLQGEVRIIKDDFWGNETILTRLGQGDVFGETYAALKNMPLEVNVISKAETSVLFIDIDKILRSCPNACIHHTELTMNFLQLLARKNIMLTSKITHLTQRTTREKLLSYLSSISMQASSNSFEIPFNRQELADYLAVDRSALSYQLSLLKKDGILSYNKNKFILY